MKTLEKVTAKVRPEYFLEKDAAFVEKYAIRSDRYLMFDIEMKGLVRVEDVYKDQTTF